MASCTFFGHRNCKKSVAELIRIYLIGIIENEGYDTFYLGNQGDYDGMVLEVLRELSEVYPHIRYSVVLAYHPSIREPVGIRPDETIFPEELVGIHPRFAIDKRNRYMLTVSECVMSYAMTAGGAMKFTEMAAKQGKYVINLADLET